MTASTQPPTDSSKFRWTDLLIIPVGFLALVSITAFMSHVVSYLDQPLFAIFYGMPAVPTLIMPLFFGLPYTYKSLTRRYVPRAAHVIAGIFSLMVLIGSSFMLLANFQEGACTFIGMPVDCSVLSFIDRWFVESAGQIVGIILSLVGFITLVVLKK